jgi:Na+(H+)/acetate symporter ActP
MSDSAVIATSVVFGVVILLILITIFALFGGMNPVISNFLVMISFFLVVVIIAIPFVEINIKVGGAPDNTSQVKNNILQAVGWTTGIFVAFIIITLMLIRRYPSQTSTFSNFFMMSSFGMSLVVLTLFTIDKTR